MNFKDLCDTIYHVLRYAKNPPIYDRLVYVGWSLSTIQSWLGHRLFCCFLH